MSKSREQEILDTIAQSDNGYDKGINFKAVEYEAHMYKKLMKEGNVLELGPAQGMMTDILCRDFFDYTVVDAAHVFVDKIIENHPSVKGICSLFEDYKPDGDGYDNILISNVLEHVADPVSLLSRCKEWLKEGGRIIASVPNANSIHRQVGVNIGILKSANELHEGDKNIGHRRVYDSNSLKRDFIEAGLSIVNGGGVFS